MWAFILKFHQAAHVSLIQNESYQQSPEKTKNNGEHEMREKISALESPEFIH